MACGTGSDYFVETPAHETISGICIDCASDSAILGEIDALTLSEAFNVDDLISQIIYAGDTVASDALTKIQALYNYQAPQLPSVTYNAPTWDDPTVYDVSVDALSVTTPPSASSTVGWNSPTFNDVDEAGGTIAAPTTTVPTIPEPPTLDDTSGTTPNAPTGYDPTIPEAPTYASPTLVMDSVGQPYLAIVDITLPEELTFDALEYTIDYGPIDEAIDRLGNIWIDESNIPDYTQLIPEVFTKVGAMLGGEGINQDLVVNDPRRLRLLVPSLARRGLDIPDAAPAYDAWMEQLFAAYIDDSATLFEAEYQDKLLRMAHTYATEAEKILVDIDIKLYDARFMYRMERVRVSLEIAKAIVALYNARVAEFEAQVLAYNAVLAVVKANANAALARAKVATTAGDANQTIAKGFALEEQLKKNEEKIFSAEIMAEAAKLKAYAAEIQAYEAKIASAKAGMLTYTGYVEQYSGDVERVKNLYKAYGLNARAVLEENRAVKAEVDGESSNLRAIGVEAGAKASAAAVEAIRKVRVSENARAKFADDSLENASGTYTIAQKVADFAQETTASRLTAAADRVLPSAVTDKAKAISDFVKTATSSSARASQMAQSANESLARAYARAYEAAGRAAAALSSGQLSGFRASASLGASGSLNASTSVNSTSSNSSSLNYSETDGASQTISV